ncbi:MAG: PAS domain S-box protein, partial [Syntrophales bacterium]|nr:PAS domain S-box protein [Syntrophales bacterium]
MTDDIYRQQAELIEKLQAEIARYRLLEKNLRESEELYRTLLQKSLAGTYVVQDGKFRDVNDNAASYAGYTREDLIGMKSDSIIHPEDRAQVKKDGRLMLRGTRIVPHTFRIITKQGQVRWIMELVTSITYEGRPAILGNSMDITELMMAQAKIGESENLYRAIFEHTGTATIIIEEDTTVSLVNEQFVTMSGYRREDWEGKRSWTEFVVPQDVERMLSYHRLRRVDPSLAPRNYEFGFIDSAGRVREVALTVGMIPGTKKSVASLADVTDHKAAERRLKESEALYRTIFETTGTAVIIIE